MSLWLSMDITLPSQKCLKIFHYQSMLKKQRISYAHMKLNLVYNPQNDDVASKTNIIKHNMIAFVLGFGNNDYIGEQRTSFYCCFMLI